MPADKKIKLYFGGPYTERAIGEIESDAIKHNISMETSRLNWFEYYFDASLRYQKSGENFFDVLLGWQLRDIYGDRVAFGPLSPAITLDTHIEGGQRYPMILLHGWSTKPKRRANGSFPISDDIVDFLGHELESLFEVEYLKFERVG